MFKTKYTSQIMLCIIFFLLILKEITVVFNNFPFIGPLLWGVSLVFLLFCIFFSKIELNRKQVILLISITVLNFFMLLSVLTYSSTSALLEAFLQIVPNYTIFFLVIADQNERQTFNFISKIIICMTSILSIVGLMIHFFGDIHFVEGKYVETYSLFGVNFTQRIVGYEQGQTRISSLTSNPNTLAWFILLTILLIFYHLILKQKHRLILVLLLGVNLIALFSTSSRSSLISLFLGIFIFLAFYMSQKNYIYLVITTLTILLFNINKILGSSKFRLNDGLSSRNIIWEKIMQSVDERIFYGIGLGSAGQLILGDFSTSTHNIYLSIFAEIGLLGLLCFIFIWFFGVYNCGYQLIIKKNKDLLYILIISILLSLFVHQFFEAQLLTFNFLSFFWWYLIVLSATLKKSKEV